VRNVFKSVADRFKSDFNAIGKSGYTPLQQAIILDDIKKVKALLTAGASPNHGHDKRSHLHFAVQRKRYPIALELVRAGADLNLQDGNGQTVLHLEVKQSQEAFLTILLKAGADTNIKDMSGRTPLHLIADPRYVDLLVAHNARVNEQDRRGDTALHRFLDYPQVVERLIDNGADVNICNNDGISPYMIMLDRKILPHYAPELQTKILLKADLGSSNPIGEKIVNLMMEIETDGVGRGLGKTALATRDANDNTVLHGLIRTLNVPAIEMVAAQAPKMVEAVNSRGFTPIEELLRRLDFTVQVQGDKWVDAIKALLEAKANPDSADGNGRSILHHAVLQGRRDFLEAVLEKGANPNLRDDTGKTPLHYAIEADDLRTMDILLDRGANPDMTDSRGWTILDRLAESGDRDSSRVQRLIVAGGQYQKQLPLYPEMMRRPKTIDKGQVVPKRAAGGKPGPQL